jgi:hypothetical protein
MVNTVYTKNRTRDIIGNILCVQNSQYFYWYKWYIQGDYKRNDGLLYDISSKQLTPGRRFRSGMREQL